MSVTDLTRTQRLTSTLATAPTQIAVAALLGSVLGRFGHNSESEWGDVIGVLVGVIVGAGLGLGVILVLVARAQGRPVWHLVVRVLVALPSAMLAILIVTALGAGFWFAYVVYLVACTAFVWWWSGRSPLDEGLPPRAD